MIPRGNRPRWARSVDQNQQAGAAGRYTFRGEPAAGVPAGQPTPPATAAPWGGPPVPTGASCPPPTAPASPDHRQWQFRV